LDEDISIDIFGPLDAEYTPSFFENSGGDQITYKGVLSRHDVDRELWEYDALILPTRWYGEGYPGVILEAYAHGMPVITTQWQSIPEIVDENSGILVEPSDVEGFADAVNRLHRDSSLYMRLQQGAREKAQLFSEEFWVEKFICWCYEVAGMNDVRSAP